MSFAGRILVLLVAVWAVTFAQASLLVAKQACQSTYTPCVPPGENPVAYKSVVQQSQHLLKDLLHSLPELSAEKRGVDEVSGGLGVRDVSIPFCCAEGTQCLLLSEYLVPFCYDKFTTNFFLPDASFGNLATGIYTRADGTSGNLITGDYRLPNGTTGNIYAADEADRPNPAMLTLPTPWTSSGVGSAIAASTLGGLKSNGTAISASSSLLSTVPAHIVAATVASGVSLPASTVSASIVCDASGPTSTAATAAVTTNRSAGGILSPTTSAADTGDGASLGTPGMLGKTALLFALLCIFSG
ncbi:MAG: hypothetical protein M1838_003202 [Thelocarpon superellum]|nr:MAG: hypothetical protein M1838_003202 [Thelocarpon superellum]